MPYSLHNIRAVAGLDSHVSGQLPEIEQRCASAQSGVAQIQYLQHAHGIEVLSSLLHLWRMQADTAMGGLPLAGREADVSGRLPGRG